MNELKKLIRLINVVLKIMAKLKENSFEPTLFMSELTELELLKDELEKGKPK